MRGWSRNISPRSRCARWARRRHSRPRSTPRRTRSRAMNWIALKMLTGDRSKSFGIIFGVAFATVLMAQQVSIFAGIMARTTSQIADVRDAEIWVMDNKVRFIDEIPPLPDTELQRVRG